MKNKLPKFLWICLWIYSATTLQAESLSVDLGSIDSKAAGDLVLNLKLKSLHGPSEIRDFEPNGTGVQSQVFSVGDGRHGKFAGDTYANFSQNSNLTGNTIRIDTDIFPELHFTEFELEASWTIRVVGSKPLIIYSQGDVSIAGDIDCGGASGLSSDADETLIVSGAEGRCGGASGGSGGYSTGLALVDATNGLSGGTNLVGGFGADSTGVLAAKGGGGGGAYAIVQAPQNPEDGVNPDGGSGGLAGTNFRDDAFVLKFGGSGGGGGAAFRTGDATENASGASGGAGGGLVIILSFGNVTLTNTGSISTNGGAGGSVSAGMRAGAGGAGGAGGVHILSAADVVLNGAVTALEGVGGTSALGGNGGKGGRGRTWIADQSGTASGSVFEDPDTLLTQRGTTDSSAGVFSWESPSIDFLSRSPVLNSVDVLTSLNGASIVTEVSSSTEFDFSPSYDLVTSLTELDNKRYWKFKITLTQDNSGLFSQITSISPDYTPNKESEFEFVSGCGSVTSSGSPPNFLIALFLLLPLGFVAILRKGIFPLNFKA